MVYVRASFTVDHTKDDKVFIIDNFDENNPTMSITNDAENVVEYLLKIYPNKRIIYKDTEGHWDELSHDGHKFIGFKPYNFEEGY